MNPNNLKQLTTKKPSPNIDKKNAQKDLTTTKSQNSQTKPTNPNKNNHQIHAINELQSYGTLQNLPLSQQQINNKKSHSNNKSSQKNQTTSKDIEIQTQPRPKGCIEKLCQCFSKRPNNQSKYQEPTTPKNQAQEAELKKSDKKNLVKQSPIPNGSDMSRFDNSKSELYELSKSQLQSVNVEEFKGEQVNEDGKSPDNQSENKNHKVEKDAKNETKDNPEPNILKLLSQHINKNSSRKPHDESSTDYKRAYTQEQNNQHYRPQNFNQQNHPYGQHYDHPSFHHPQQFPQNFQHGHFNPHLHPHGSSPINFFGGRHPYQEFPQQLPHLVAQNIAQRFSPQTHQYNNIRPQQGYQQQRSRPSHPLDRNYPRKLEQTESEMIASKFSYMNLNDSGVQSSGNNRFESFSKRQNNQPKSNIIQDGQVQEYGDNKNLQETPSFRLTQSIINRDTYDNEEFSQYFKDEQKMASSQINIQKIGQFIDSSISRPNLSALASVPLQRSAISNNDYDQGNFMAQTKRRESFFIQNAKQSEGKLSGSFSNQPTGQQGDKPNIQSDMSKRKMVEKTLKNVNGKNKGANPNIKDDQVKTVHGCHCHQLKCETNYCACKRANKKCTAACKCVKSDCKNLSKQQYEHRPQQQLVSLIVLTKQLGRYG